ncbi:MAG: CRISPR-associated helicase Cas3' [Rhabdochlamydiaceae bacterium]
MIFLAKSVDYGGTSLFDHSKSVAERAQLLASTIKFEMKKSAYLSGLLHDIGKLNPYYQQSLPIQNKDERDFKMKKLAETYLDQHSVFSAWASKKLLEDKIVNNELTRVICTILGHHGRLTNSSYNVRDKPKTKKSQNEILANLKDYQKELESLNLPDFDWTKLCEQFTQDISFQDEIDTNEQNGITDFMHTCTLFSCLLQADRTDGKDFKIPKFDIRFNTKDLVVGGALQDLRKSFFENALKTHDFESGMVIIEAPTGIGKTRLFLEIANKYSQIQNLERVFYFSPLLALTEDFEEKIVGKKVIDSLEDVLIYNHLFSTTLQEKSKSEEVISIFTKLIEYETFNKKFIITTTMRLLLTIYSNTVSDKLKLLSFKNSLLIVDEIQTIPKILLENLIEVFQILSKNLNCKILFVSATIPYEMGDKIPRTRPEENLRLEYLYKTSKNIKFVDGSPQLPNEYKKMLIMLNTRRNARDFYNNALKVYGNDVKYITSGIRKDDKITIIKEIKSSKKIVIISTQVIQAGIDVSFTSLYRQMAPLDDLIQTAGRLNREGDDTDATMTIFRLQKANEYVPYVDLEYDESLKLIKNIHSSTELLEALPGYYKEIFEQNQTNKNKAKRLRDLMVKQNFEEVWEFTREYIPDDRNDSVIIPKNREEWQKIKKSFSSDKKFNAKLKKDYEMLTADLPIRPTDLRIKDSFDPELLAMNILMPNIEQYEDGIISETFYHHALGLDIWIQ